MVPFLIKPLLLAGYITEIACIQVCPVTCNRPPSLAQLSVLADIAGYLVFGFVINIGALFGSRAFGFISGLSTPMTRALISKHTPKNEQVGQDAYAPCIQASRHAGKHLLGGGRA